ncbi:hypothetical protein Q5735_16085, partial [Lactiplantibacillus plantarum]|nr:hypothetical protein [Lactiplantibacillus plantarum]
FPWDRYSVLYALLVLWADKILHLVLFKFFILVAKTNAFYLLFYLYMLCRAHDNGFLIGAGCNKYLLFNLFLVTFYYVRLLFFIFLSICFFGVVVFVALV